MSADANAIKDQVRQFVLDYAKGRGVTEVADDESLFKTNIVDSLGVFRMIAFLEGAFPITIEDTDIVPENFHTISAIEGFIAGKMGSGATGPCAQASAAAD